MIRSDKNFIYQSGTTNNQIYDARGSHIRDCMIIGFTCAYAISAYHRWSCEFDIYLHMIRCIWYNNMWSNLSVTCWILVKVARAHTHRAAQRNRSCRMGGGMLLLYGIKAWPWVKKCVGTYCSLYKSLNLLSLLNSPCFFNASHFPSWPISPSFLSGFYMSLNLFSSWILLKYCSMDIK